MADEALNMIDAPPMSVISGALVIGVEAGAVKVQEADGGDDLVAPRPVEMEVRALADLGNELRPPSNRTTWTPTGPSSCGSSQRLRNPEMAIRSV
jgi:hypothetical protein